MPKRLTITKKQSAMLVAVIAFGVLIATRPTSRLFFMGTQQTRIKSGEWVTVGPSLRISDARFEAIVNAVNARGDVSCMRISNPTITDQAFKQIRKLTTLHWLYIEDATISDAALDNLQPLRNLTKIHFARCPNLTIAAIDALREEMPECSIHVDSYTMPTSNQKTGSGNPDEP